MYCALEEVDLDTDVCPVKCMYKHSSGKCVHAELAYEENLDAEKMAAILNIPVSEVQEEVQKSAKRIKVALVAEAYISYATKDELQTVKTAENDKVLPIFRLLKINPSKLKQLLLRSKYEKWREITKVDVPFETLCLLFQRALIKSNERS